MGLKLISGKGGVGKSYVTALLSKKMPEAKLFDCSHDLETTLQSLRIPFSEVQKRDDDEIIFRAIKTFLKIDKIARWASENRIVQNLFRLAPNLLEFLLLYQWIQIAEKEDLIVDAPSTGNFMGILRAAQSARKMFDAGQMKTMADKIEKFLNDPKKTEFYLVSIPELSALQELAELRKDLAELFPSAKIIQVLNRKHALLADWESLPEALQFLAHERPILEEKRCTPYHFDFVVPEGGSKLG